MLWYLFAIALLSLIYFVFVKPFTYWEKQGIVQYKFWKIWLRNTLEAIKQPPLTDGIQKLYNDFLDHSVKDPALIKNIFVKDFEHFADHTMFIPTDGDPILEHTLFTATGDKWRHLRGIGSPSFTGGKMKIMLELMQEYAPQLMSYLEDQNSDLLTFEMKDLFSRITNDLFVSTHFGVICDSLKDRENLFYTVGIKLVDFSGIWLKVRFVLVQMIPRITKKLGITLIDQHMSRLFMKLVKENIETREKLGIVRQDLIHHLKETQKSNNEKCKNEVVDSGFAAVKESIQPHKKNVVNYQLSNEELTAMALSFFGGGLDSTSTLLCFMAYELALHPEAQEKLQHEIDAMLNKCNGSLTYEDLLGMKYLDMVISETLRKWPGGFFLDRKCVKPYTIEPIKPEEKPVYLNKGDAVWIPLFALHRDPQYHPEPERFDPERFSNENKSSIVPYTFMPFGSGPRHCIGNRFALLQIKVVSFHILSKYSFVPVEKTAIPLRLARRSLQLASKDDFWLGLRRRKQKV